MASSTKKTKRNLSESDSENEAADFPRFIVIESLKKVCLAKFAPLFIEKVISSRAAPRQLASQGGKLETDRKHIKNENLSCDEMQSLLA